jgi:hypothetical protein
MHKTQRGSEGIIFLKLFTREILLQILERKKFKQIIEPEIRMEENTEKVLKEKIKNLDQRRIMIHRENLPLFQSTIIPIEQPKKEEKPIEKIEAPTEKPDESLNSMERSISSTKKEVAEIKTTPPRMNMNKLLGHPMQNNNMPPMEKIGPLLRDNTIVAIECPGPGKNVMIKKYNQMNMTRIILSQEDINGVIEYFSNEARIPLAGGILKAAVGNAIISAVVSEFVGSRFIINKITPYSLIGPR